MATSDSELAFIFPGQGSQSVGMMADLAGSYAVVNDVFNEASAALGYDLWQLIQNGPEDDLNQTDKTQPAMLAAGVATWRVWQQASSVTPTLMAGHSLGEYTALVCTGALKLADAVALVSERGRFMQQAVPSGTGAMAAVLGLNDDQVRQACSVAAQDEVVSAVNFNAPGQVVIAGHTAAVLRAINEAKAAGAKRAIQLPVSVPSHCQLMQPAAEKMQQRLAEIEITQPIIPVINNVDVAVTGDADKIRDALVRQLYMPVRWVETITYMHNNGISTAIESGPGKVLTGLNKRINKDMRCLPFVDASSLQTALTALEKSEELS